MPLISLAITAICNGSYQNNQDACNKALVATAMQTQVYNYDEKLEKYAESNVRNMATDYVGQEPIKFAGSAYYVFNVIKNKSLSFNLPTLGLCNGASNDITVSSYTLNLKWDFPWLK